MPEDLPIACSLDATEVSERLRTMSQLGRDALIDAHSDGSRALLRFAHRDGVRRRLKAIVAAESRCCPFLVMRLDEDGDAVALRIDAPSGGEAVLAGIVEAFACARAAG